MSNKILPAPPQLTDFPFGVQVYFLDGGMMKIQQANGPVTVPEGKENALIVYQACGPDTQPWGPAYVWDQAINAGRGFWVEYDPDIHKVPSPEDESQAVPSEDEPECPEVEVEEPAEGQIESVIDLGPPLELTPMTLEEEVVEEPAKVEKKRRKTPRLREDG